MTAAVLEKTQVLPTAEAASSALIEVKNLTTEFTTHDGALRAVNGVSLTVKPGRVLAILGESGSGKSMLLRTILGIQPKSARVEGEVLMRGANLLEMDASERERIRGTWLAMVFQDPMTALDPLFTVEQQIVETIRRHTPMPRAEASQRTLDLLRLVQIPSPERRLKAYPFELSGGMRQRVVIAIALACNPSLLLADEPTTALDVTVQARVLSLLKNLRAQLGMGLVLVTHDLAVASSIADDVAVMYAGRIVEYGTVREIANRPHHPYTQGLLEANVRPGQLVRPVAIPGSPPNLAHLSMGCAFAPRCSVAQDICWEEMPELLVRSGSHHSRCLLTA
jgi:oligopeptide/dipeptide ABC transporter ATP-binding protein